MCTDGSKVKMEDLISPDWASAPENATYSLNFKLVNPRVPSIDEVERYLRTLDYGLEHQKEDIWDCFDRSLWGIAHARHRFPGIAIGLAEGISRLEGTYGQNHALIIIWEKGLANYRYFDPSNQDSISFSSEPLRIKRIIAFPFDTNGHYTTVELIRGQYMSRIKDGNYISYKKNYCLYPLEGQKQEQKGILDYLYGHEYEFSCIDLNGHQWIDGFSFKEYWRDEDWAFWTYIHVRRAYKGCAIGVAYGEQEFSRSSFVNVIWRKLDGNGKIEPLFWDPSPEKRGIVPNFRPKMLLF